MAGFAHSAECGGMEQCSIKPRLRPEEGAIGQAAETGRGGVEHHGKERFGTPVSSPYIWMATDYTEHVTLSATNSLMPKNGSLEKEMKIPRLLAYGLTILLYMVGAAKAERWVDVRKGNSPILHQIDSDSLDRVPPSGYGLTWRNGIEGELMLTVNGMVNCREFSVGRLTSTARNKGGEIARDYMAGTVTTSGVLRAMTAQEKVLTFSFPNSKNSDGVLIEHICAEESILVSLRKESEDMLKRVVCKPDLSVPPVCNRIDDLIVPNSLLVLRVRQAIQACGKDRQVVFGLLANSLKRVRDCRDSLECGVELLNRDVEYLGQDLSKAIQGMSCTYLESFVTANNAASTRAALELPFKVCAQGLVTKLDDRLSPADVVASAIYRTCHRELPNSLTTAEIAIEIKEHLATAVLERRAKEMSKIIEEKRKSKNANR